MSRALTGPKTCLRINGIKIAYVAGLNISEENTLTAIDVLDQLEVAEHCETAHIVSFSCQVFRILENGAITLGLTPENLSDILTQPELTMDVFNSVEDRIEYTMSGVKFEGGSGSVEARGVWRGEWRFKGRIGRGL